MDGTAVKPEVHMNLDYALNNMASKSSFGTTSAKTFSYKGPKAAEIRI
jgi:hypothetical protein